VNAGGLQSGQSKRRKFVEGEIKKAESKVNPEKRLGGNPKEGKGLLRKTPRWGVMHGDWGSNAMAEGKKAKA